MRQSRTAMAAAAALLGLLVLASVADVAHAVDRSKFRTCEKAAFCKRNRAFHGASTFVPQHYELDAASVKVTADASTVTADLRNGRHPLQDPLQLTVSVLANGVARVAIREHNPLHPRWEVPEVTQAPAMQPISPAATITTAAAGSDASAPAVTIKFGAAGEHELTIAAKPFVVTLSVNGAPAVLLNSHNKLVFEQYRTANPKPADAAADADPSPHLMKFPYDSDGMWQESFGGHSDSKPRGPSAVGLDIAFPGSLHVYGIPEHASSFALKTTVGDGHGQYNEPYRLWNLDVFEYELDNPMALYGAVPFLISHDAAKTVGVLWLNSAETYIDIKNGADKAGLLSSGIPRKDTHWLSESGIIDVYLFPGPSAPALLRQYTALTGTQQLPPEFAIAYHQCRWNYKSSDDVAAVDAGFDAHDIPYDVLWLDIEHTDGKKYFTWDHGLFPAPRVMQNALAAKGRKMVTIVDPHIKRDASYPVHKRAEENDFYVKTSAKNTYEGWCWPGSVSYLDFVLPEVRDYWARQFSLSEYDGSTPHLHIWNDMNEPSVFNGPEVSMPKDCLHVKGTVEHRDTHNLYGFFHHWSTERGVRERSGSTERAFVLTRSFFAGSQRWGAVWTGDNMAKWDHLAVSTPMLLTLGMTGIQFSGADVGGFFGDPDAELLTRWYQTGVWQPFFRGHAHIDTKRREPWLFGEPYTSHIRNAIRTRYQFLPYLYTTFFAASAVGLPVLRPLWLEFPADESVFATDDQFMLGSALLVKPVATAKQASTSVYLPGVGPWYELHTGIASAPGTSAATGGGVTLSGVATPLSHIPVYQRGGSIIPKKERARRSSALMRNDPYTLLVALDTQASADGVLYLDDGRSFEYAKGAFVVRRFAFAANTLTGSAFVGAAAAAGAGASAALTVPTTPGTATYTPTATIERVVVLGITRKLAAVTLGTGEKLVFEQTLADPSTYSSAAPVVDRVVVRKPNVGIASDFTIHFQFA